MDDASPWRRHRALAVLAQAWPRLPAVDPPSCATLREWLERSDAGATWRLGRPADPTASQEAGSYEARVTAGVIPTREGSWHDAFNVLAFIAFPRTKAALHARSWQLQRTRLAATGRRGNRSREEDALAVLDEASLVLAGNPSAVEAVDRARAADDLGQLDAVVRARGVGAYVLGHALLEHLVLGRDPIGAGVVTLAVPAPTRAAVDDALARRIAAGGFPIPRVSPTLPWPHPVVDGWITG